MSDLRKHFSEIGGEEALRMVGTLDVMDYTVEFIRDDLRAEYSEGDIETGYRSLMANQVSTDDFGQVGSFGELDAQVIFFEHVIMFLCPSARYDSVFASLDRDSDVPVRDVLGLVEELPKLFGENET